MKKQVLSPLCSALVIPGLGQVLNHEIKKGLSILSLVFVLLVAGVVKLALMIRSMVVEADFAPSTAADVLNRLRAENLSFLYMLLLVFALLWVYSVLDAFWVARKQGNDTEAGTP